MHEFVLMIKGKLKTYHRYEDIPEDFDHVIKFVPYIPPGPHTHEQHEEIDRWPQRLQVLMEKERAKENKNASSNT